MIRVHVVLHIDTESAKVREVAFYSHPALAIVHDLKSFVCDVFASSGETWEVAESNALWHIGQSPLHRWMIPLLEQKYQGREELKGG